MHLKIRKRIILFALPFVIGTFIYHIIGNIWVSFAFFVPGIIYGVYLTAINSSLAIWILLFFGQDLFGLVPPIPVGDGTLLWSEVNAIYAIIFFVVHIKQIKNYRYGIALLIFYAFFCIATIRAKIIYDQDIIITILSGREYLSLVAFWPIACYINYSFANKMNFISIVLKNAKLTMILGLITKICVSFGLQITFFAANERWGTRIYINTVLILIYFFYYLYFLLYGNNKSCLKNCLLSFLIIVFVSQSRSTIICMIVATAVMILTSNQVKKITKYSIMFIAAVIILLSISPQIRTAVFSAALEYLNEEGTVGARVVERTYFDDRLKGHEILGVGIPNNHTANALDYSGMYTDFNHQKYNYYYIVDLGSYQIKYQFGIIAYILYYILLCLVIIKTFLHRRMSSFAFVGCSVFVLMLIINEFICFIGRDFGFVIVLALVETCDIKSEYYLQEDDRKVLQSGIMFNQSI